MVDELWQEQTLLRLLNLVELPLLEGILQCSQTPSSPLPSHLHNNQDLTYSSNHLDRQILRAFRDTQYVWLVLALLTVELILLNNLLLKDAVLRQYMTAPLSLHVFMLRALEVVFFFFF